MSSQPYQRKGKHCSVKKKYSHIRIIPLDFDADTSIANIHNRLQMLVINIRKSRINVMKYFNYETTDNVHHKKVDAL